MKESCNTCREYEPTLKWSKGELKEISTGHCKLRNGYSYRSRFCKKFEVKI